MWVRASAIRPVPVFAKVHANALEGVRLSLSCDEDAGALLDDAFDRFEQEQPCLSAHIGDVLSEPLDEESLALGYFLALAIWLAFDKAHGDQVDQVSPESIRATQELLELDEELRRADPSESLDSEDVIAMEQPDLLEFVHEHVNTSIDSGEQDIQVEHLDTIYRVVLVQILTLSYAVARPAGFPLGQIEMHA